jgi:hypothetical protein
MSDLEDFINAIDHMNANWLDYLLGEDAASGVIRIDLMLSGGKMDNGDTLESTVRFFRKIGWQS